MPANGADRPSSGISGFVFPQPARRFPFLPTKLHPHVLLVFEMAPATRAQPELHGRDPLLRADARSRKPQKHHVSGPEALQELPRTDKSREPVRGGVSEA